MVVNHSCSWSVEQGSIFFCPLSRLRICSLATSSAVPPRASPDIFRAQVEFGELFLCEISSAKAREDFFSSIAHVLEETAML